MGTKEYKKWDWYMEHVSTWGTATPKAREQVEHGTRERIKKKARQRQGHLQYETLEAWERVRWGHWRHGRQHVRHVARQACEHVGHVIQQTRK